MFQIVFVGTADMIVNKTDNVFTMIIKFTS